MKRHLRLGFLVLSFIGAMRLAVSGTLPTWAATVLVPAPLVALFWRDRVLLVGTLIGLPCLGVGSLVDPWETHYAEVAREMIERRDVISPWWANEGWFTTKPVLTFWLEAISMLAFGGHTGPDQILAGGAHPEWAIRFPHFAIALAGSWLLADGVARVAGKRAGFLTGLVLWTMAGFAMLSHQAMTDMPLVGGVAASLGLLLRAFTTHDGETHAKAGWWLAAGIAVLIAPQLVAIALEPHHLAAGDPNVCGLPSQPACVVTAAAHPRLRPLLQVALWLAPTAWLVLRIGEEKRVARLCALGAWAFASIATMAKGPAGLAVPAAGALVVILMRRSWRDFVRLEVPSGLVLAIALIGPWYLAIYARHGRGFLDELVMRHMLGRTLGHLHDTNQGEDVGIVYFIRQLGYATFPWCGLAPFALLGAARERGRMIPRALMIGAALASFVLVSSMQTKFHHYMLIVLPPVAALLGMWLAQRRRDAWMGALVVAAGVATLLVGRDLMESPARFMWLLTYRYARTWPSTHAFGIAFLVVAIAMLVPRVKYAVAILATALLLDVYLPRASHDGGQRELMSAFHNDRPDHHELIAYQLNWKGESFYTGNHVAIFVSSGPPLRAYLDRERQKGERTFYFATERGRVDGLRREVAAPSFAEIATSAEFAVVRATF
jgi:4-amino-4-deoxy-L-arabinose transferase-like glycosyltransferase